MRLRWCSPTCRTYSEAIFKKPYFPVPLEKLGATIEYHQLEPRKPVVFEDIKVTPYELDHPDPCWGYKFESGGKVLSSTALIRNAPA